VDRAASCLRVFLEGSLIYALSTLDKTVLLAISCFDALLFVFMGGLFLSLTFGTFFILKSGKLCRVAYFFWRSYISIADIIEITYKPTFFIGRLGVMRGETERGKRHGEQT
jgi:hypothetical protein